MANENTETIRGIYARWAEGDFSAGPEHFDPNLVFIMRPGVPRFRHLPGARAGRRVHAHLPRAMGVDHDRGDGGHRGGRQRHRGRDPARARNGQQGRDRFQLLQRLDLPRPQRSSASRPSGSAKRRSRLSGSTSSRRFTSEALWSYTDGPAASRASTRSKVGMNAGRPPLCEGEDMRDVSLEVDPACAVLGDETGKHDDVGARVQVDARVQKRHSAKTSSRIADHSLTPFRPRKTLNVSGDERGNPNFEVRRGIVGKRGPQIAPG